MRRRPALPFRRCGRNCSRSGRRRQAEAGGWREGRGFIGLGRMGSAIAARVLSGDHDLLVFNRHPPEGGVPRSNGGLCPPSALVGQIRQIEEGSVSGSS